MPLRKFLFISYYFPPAGGPGAIRPSKFCRHLPEFGWQPVVLTVKDITYYTRDLTLLEDVASIRIIRTESFDPARILYYLGKRSVRWTGSPPPLNWIFNLPDSKLGWFIPAISAGLNLTRKTELIFATAPPFTSLLIGLALAQLTKKPLIVDFRDAWLEFPFVPYRGIYRYINSFLEYEVVKHCQHIIVVSQAIQNNLFKRYNFLKNRLTVIPNGYDRSDFEDAAPAADFTITHLGTLRKSRNPELFFRALKALLEEKKISVRTRVKFIGNTIPEVFNLVHELKLDQNVTFYQYLPYKRAIEELKTSHLLLMLTDPESQIFPSRQCEYLATGCPIIVLGPSPASEILNIARSSYSYPVENITQDDLPRIKDTILFYYRRYKKRKLKRHPVFFEKFDRHHQSAEIARIFNRVTRG